jgi:hypothetical protein
MASTKKQNIKHKSNNKASSRQKSHAGGTSGVRSYSMLLLRTTCERRSRKKSRGREMGREGCLGFA